MQLQVIKPLRECLEDAPHPSEHWLWCLECERFFHLSSVAERGQGIPRCPFSDCTGHGYDFNLFFWDTYREPEDPRWPASAAELRHGMRSPDWETFYEARTEARILWLLREFAASPECRELLGDPPRYIRPFVKMFSDFTWDLMDDEGCCVIEDDLTLELLQDLPVWAQTADLSEAPRMLDELRALYCFADLSEAPRMLDELRALYCFAERTGYLAHAAAWRRLLADDSIVDIFRHTMRTDRRLRPPPPRKRPGTRKRERSRKRRR